MAFPTAPWWLLLAVCFAGCSSTQRVTLGEASSEGAASALRAEQAEITMTDGSVVTGRSLVVEADSTSWIDPDSRALVRVSTSEVARVTQRSRGRGAVQGALLTGLATAVVVGTAAYLDTDDWGRFESARPAFGATVGVMAFLPGTLPGAAIGFASGAERRYEIRPDGPPAPDSTAGLSASLGSDILSGPRR